MTPAINTGFSVIFDLDGTLVDSLPGIVSSIRYALRNHDCDITHERVRSLIGPPVREVLKALAGPMTDRDLTSAESEFRAAYDSNGWRETHPFAAARETLEALRLRGSRLFLFTNKPQNVTTCIMTELGLKSLFEDCFSKDSRQPPYQTKTEMLGALRDKHHLVCEECLVVGDSREDFEAARKLNMQFAFATYGYGRLNDMAPGPDFIEIENLDALIASDMEYSQ